VNVGACQWKRSERGFIRSVNEHRSTRRTIDWKIGFVPMDGTCRVHVERHELMKKNLLPGRQESVDKIDTITAERRRSVCRIK